MRILLITICWLLLSYNAIALAAKPFVYNLELGPKIITNSCVLDNNTIVVADGIDGNTLYIINSLSHDVFNIAGDTIKFNVDEKILDFTINYQRALIYVLLDSGRVVAAHAKTYQQREITRVATKADTGFIAIQHNLLLITADDTVLLIDLTTNQRTTCYRPDNNIAISCAPKFIKLQHDWLIALALQHRGRRHAMVKIIDTTGSLKVHKDLPTVPKIDAWQLFDSRALNLVDNIILYNLQNNLLYHWELPDKLQRLPSHENTNVIFSDLSGGRKIFLRAGRKIIVDFTNLAKLQTAGWSLQASGQLPGLPQALAAPWAGLYWDAQYRRHVLLLLKQKNYLIYTIQLPEDQPRRLSWKIEGNVR